VTVQSWQKLRFGPFLPTLTTFLAYSPLTQFFRLWQADSSLLELSHVKFSKDFYVSSGRK